MVPCTDRISSRLSILIFRDPTFWAPPKRALSSFVFWFTSIICAPAMSCIAIDDVIMGVIPVGTGQDGMGRGAEGERGRKTKKQNHQDKKKKTKKKSVVKNHRNEKRCSLGPVHHSKHTVYTPIQQPSKSHLLVVPLYCTLQPYIHRDLYIYIYTDVKENAFRFLPPCDYWKVHSWRTGNTCVVCSLWEQCDFFF